jgi:hypothetical protein
MAQALRALIVFSLFDGKRENFEKKLLRLKTASMSTGLDSMLHSPREIGRANSSGQDKTFFG